MRERYFTSSDYAILPPYTGYGLFLAHRESVSWHPQENIPIEESALEYRQDKRITAMSLSGEYPSQENGLALTFSSHLNHVRKSKSRIMRPACITSMAPPTLPQDTVRLPHMVTVRRSRSLTDTVIWELQTIQEAEQWLGEPLHDIDYVESHIGKLINLRQQLRNNTLNKSKASLELQSRLKEGRYLSALFVYQNLELLKDLLTD